MSKQPSNAPGQEAEDISSENEVEQQAAENEQNTEQATSVEDEVNTKFQDLVDKAGISQATGNAAQAAELDLAEENAKLKDQLLRAMADADNTRKRAKQQLEDAAKFAISNFAKDLISVLDNIYRASESFADVDASDDKVAVLKEGVDLTMSEFLKVCDRHGIERVFPEGEAFDHNFHQAIANVPSADHTPGTVIQVMQAGYKLKDRLLRPAMVTVAKEAE